MILAGNYEAAISRLLEKQARANAAAPMRPVLKGTVRAKPAQSRAQSAMARTKTA